MPQVQGADVGNELCVEEIGKECANFMIILNFIKMWSYSPTGHACSVQMCNNLSTLYIYIYDKHLFTTFDTDGGTNAFPSTREVICADGLPVAVGLMTDFPLELHSGQSKVRCLLSYKKPLMQLAEAEVTANGGAYLLAE